MRSTPPDLLAVVPNGASSWGGVPVSPVGSALDRRGAGHLTVTFESGLPDDGGESNNNGVATLSSGSTSTDAALSVRLSTVVGDIPFGTLANGADLARDDSKPFSLDRKD